jgi:hypothetical protein
MGMFITENLFFAFIMNKNEFVTKPSTNARLSLQVQSNAHISGLFSSNISFAHYEYD